MIILLVLQRILSDPRTPFTLKPTVSTTLEASDSQSLVDCSIYVVQSRSRWLNVHAKPLMAMQILDPRRLSSSSLLLRDPTLIVRSAYQDRGFITTPVALVGHRYLCTEIGPLSECEVVLE